MNNFVYGVDSGILGVLLKLYCSKVLLLRFKIFVTFYVLFLLMSAEIPHMKTAELHFECKDLKEGIVKSCLTNLVFSCAIFFYDLQCLLKAWLTEKEEALSKVQTSNFKDQTDLSVNVRKLAVSTTILLYPVKFHRLNEWQITSLTPRRSFECMILWKPANILSLPDSFN